MRLLRLSLVAAAVAVLLVGTAPTAQASCAMSVTGNPYDDAALVFVGEVAATEHDGYEAHVVVEQLWRGQAPKPIVTVVGGPLRAGVGQEDSLRLREGTTYVFDVSGEGSSYVANACSATRPYAQVPERFRPDGLPPPKADPALLRRASALGDNGSPHLLVGAAIAGVAVSSLVAWRRRPSTRLRP